MSSICGLTPKHKDLISSSSSSSSSYSICSTSSTSSSLSTCSKSTTSNESLHGNEEGPSSLVCQYNSKVAESDNKLVRRASLGHKLMNVIASCKNNTVKRMGKKRKDLMENLPPLLQPLPPTETERGCLVIDLDETLIHSTFKPMGTADFTLGIQLDDTFYNVYMCVRPGAEEFIRKMSKLYELVIFTASLGKYADPLIDIIDKDHLVKHRLFRDSCEVHQGLYVKDLSRLGRNVRKTIIVDNSPAAYMLHPQNGIAISSWIGDKNDHELNDVSELLESVSQENDLVLALAKKHCEKTRLKK